MLGLTKMKAPLAGGRLHEIRLHPTSDFESRNSEGRRSQFAVRHIALLRKALAYFQYFNTVPSQCRTFVIRRRETFRSRACSLSRRSVVLQFALLCCAPREYTFFVNSYKWQKG